MSDTGRWRHTVPNYLTLSRLIIAVLMAFVIATAATLWLFEIIGSLDVLKYSLTVATVAAVVAFATDYLDGWWVRRWPESGSVWGQKWDPVADKAAVLVYLGYLFCAGAIPFGVNAETVMVLIILSREIAVSVLREMVGHENVPVVAGGKWKTTFQMLALLAYGTAVVPEWVPALLLLLATILTLWSGWQYFRPILYRSLVD
ncbi:CDP-alcohol phosphatidyltransferase family protein [Candidatus Pacebacteria bacterium]|nr:CDP-alcohol phosphatidyltransferase family protein [Candidatus Paceibacterota bacterium]